MSQDNILAVSYFTALQGVLGEAASNCKGNTKLNEVIYRDGSKTEEVEDDLTICVIVLDDYTTLVGSSLGTSQDKSTARQRAYQDALNQTAK